MDNFTVQRLLMAIAEANKISTPSTTTTTVAAAAAAVLEMASPPKKPQTRCGACKHKLALSDMECKCGVRHCSKHRMPEDHACAFDFKAHDRAVLGKQLVACVGDKIDARI
jgi:predicted nucleic acid binding AN1-type Zn finger protein